MSDDQPQRTRDLPRGLISITYHGKAAHVALDGVDISGVCSSATVRLRRGSVPVVVLELLPTAVVISTPAGLDLRLPSRRGTRVRAVLDSPADGEGARR